jgi:anti-anti-sigma factor
MWVEDRLPVGLKGGTNSLVVSGEIDSSTAGGLAEAICAVRASPVVVDVSGVTFMDGAGVRQFVQAKVVLEALGAALIIRGAPRAVQLVFSALGMADWLETV